MTVSLAFGYKAGIPDSVTTAWGARAIFDSYGLDIVPDRQDWVGPRNKELMEALSDRIPLNELKKSAGEQVFPDSVGLDPMEYVLFADDTVIVKANTQKSYGYLYLCAYFLDEEA